MIESWQSFDDPDVNLSMYRFAERLWPICRSLTGEGVRETLHLIRERLPDLAIHEVPSGTRCFDWQVPNEWNIRDAYLIGPDGEKVVEFRNNNLHVVGYSEPVDRMMSLEELRPHLFSLPDQPDAIPYVTSYYKRFFGFCLSHRQLQSLKEGTYRVVIDSTLQPGSLTYADLVLPGRTEKEVFLSTYVCHPSLANNELSGPVVTVALAQWLMSQKDRRYTYRIYFGPETIGAIVYLSRHLDHLKRQVLAGYVVTCVGDDRAFSLLSSRYGDTMVDRLTSRVLTEVVGEFKRYSFLQRGSDERQYGSPGVDLPMVSVMRTRYGSYPEYHTSLDDLSIISPAGLGGALKVLKSCLTALEWNQTYRVAQPCEPQLGKRGLYPTISTKASGISVRQMMDVLAYSDGRNDLLRISEIIGVPLLDVARIIRPLIEAGVVVEV